MTIEELSNKLIEKLKSQPNQKGDESEVQSLWDEYKEQLQLQLSPDYSFFNQELESIADNEIADFSDEDIIIILRSYYSNYVPDIENLRGDLMDSIYYIIYNRALIEEFVYSKEQFRYLKNFEEEDEIPQVEALIKLGDKWEEKFLKDNPGTEERQSTTMAAETTQPQEQQQPLVPKTFPVSFDDERLLPANAVVQPNGTYLLEQTYPTFEEAEKVQKAIEKKFGHKGYKTTVESKSTDETNPFADEIYSVLIDTNPAIPILTEQKVDKEETRLEIRDELAEIPNQVTDIDGNVYHTITIGKQVWMVENLKTTKYNDCTAIPLVTEAKVWSDLSTPAYCWYKNNEAVSKAIYGALYNWFTIDTGKLSPKGWHVPSDGEWTTLIEFLGGESVAGGKLKEASTSHWALPNEGATNENGFSALPGGTRYFDDSKFLRIGCLGSWWSITADNNGDAWFRFIYYHRSNIYRRSLRKTLGVSVRCIRDD